MGGPDPQGAHLAVWAFDTLLGLLRVNGGEWAARGRLLQCPRGRRGSELGFGVGLVHGFKLAAGGLPVLLYQVLDNLITQVPQARKPAGQ